MDIKRYKELLQNKRNLSITLGAICLIIAMIINSGSTQHIAITLDEKVIGYAESSEVIKLGIEQAELKKSEELSVDVLIKPDVLMQENFEEKVKTLITAEEIAALLIRDEYFLVNSFSVYIEGEPVVAVESKEVANLVVEETKGEYTEENSKIISMTIEEDIDIKATQSEVSEIMSLEDAKRMILTGTTEEKIYTVVSGDSNWKIARENGISVDDINNANPGIDSNWIQIGQELNLITPKPYLTVSVEEEATYTEKIGFGVTYEKTDALYEGEEKVKSYGEYGEKEIKAVIIKENNQEVERDIISSSVVRDSTNQVVLLGTAAIPNSLGTGNLDTPTRGLVSSVYGPRWGGFHSAVDLANSIGTSIYAADGGIVTYSGWRGNYGYCIMINHGNDIQTLYAHNSELIVSKGDKVEKGQLISKMGDTGFVTGPHLHFEVRVNGVPVDPKKYIDY